MTMKAECDFKGRAILVVEDEYLLALDLVEQLTLSGARVIGPFPDLSAALTVVDQGEVDGAIIDIRLQTRVAFDLADLLAARHTPFVFATGSSKVEVPPKHRSTSFFEKPYDPAEVVTTLCRSLGQIQ